MSAVSRGSNWTETPPGKVRVAIVAYMFLIAHAHFTFRIQVLLLLVWSTAARLTWSQPGVCDLMPWWPGCS